MRLFRRRQSMNVRFVDTSAGRSLEVVDSHTCEQARRTGIHTHQRTHHVHPPTHPPTNFLRAFSPHIILTSQSPTQPPALSPSRSSRKILPQNHYRPRASVGTGHQCAPLPKPIVHGRTLCGHDAHTHTHPPTSPVSITKTSHLLFNSFSSHRTIIAPGLA